MVLPIIIGLLAAGVIYYLSKDDETPRCPYCKGFVKRNARKCRKCNAKLGWE